MKLVVRSFVAFLLPLLAINGCSTSTEVNGGAGKYNGGGGDDNSFTTLFAGAYNTGMFFSNDTGNSWHAATQNTAQRLYCIASGAKYTFAATTASGLFRSSDNGVTWTLVTGLTD